MTTPGPLAEPAELPLYPAEVVQQLGSTLVIAPHPDDESLGCGGLLALLSQYQQPTQILFVSDGTASHPHSRAYPPQRLRALRELEALAALAALGVQSSQATFLHLPDRQVPGAGTTGFADALARISSVVQDQLPATVVLPWERDPHPDHRASWQLVQAACQTLPQPPRILEYPIWLKVIGTQNDLPASGERFGWRLDIQQVWHQKQQAIAAHQSQLGTVITDDPAGFTLDAKALEQFTPPWEIYLEHVVP